MSLPAIEVSGLSKRYVIEHESRHDSLRDTLHHAARKLWRRARWGTSFDKEEFWALRDVSFAIQPGEVVGIIGRNGAGKSTLLKILSRITEPTSGKITIRGRVASLLEVGTGFHPDLTGRENVYLNGAILGMSRVEIRKKFDEIVAFAEVEKFLDTPVKRYSSGMYVRLAFAVAAHLDPEILIVDEVLAVGDAQFQKKCIGKIQEVSHAGGRTVLLVSHNAATVQKLCSHAILMHAGTIQKTGTAQTVLAEYLGSRQGLPTPFVDLAQKTTGRKGTGRIKFKTFTIKDQEENATSVVAAGAPFVVELELASSIVSQNTLLGFSFIANDGLEIMGTAAHDGGLAMTISPGVHRYRCNISPNILLPGRYTVRAATFTQQELYDHIDEVLTFDINEIRSDISTTPSGHKVGYVYVPWRWSHESTSGIPIEK